MRRNRSLRSRLSRSGGAATEGSGLGVEPEPSGGPQAACPQDRALGNLAVFPGLGDALMPATAAPRFAAWSYRAYARFYTVWVISRRRELPAGYTTRDMARDYAAAIEQIGPPVDVLGLSQGSLIAQHLAADFPALVRTLVLALAGARGEPRSIERMQRWIAWARQGRWEKVYRDTVDATFRGPSRLFWRAIAPLATGKPEWPSDFIVSAEAAIAHNAVDRVPEIGAQTLVIGGARDALVPAGRYRELAALIPFATLFLMPRGAHGVDAQQKRKFERTVLWFLQLRCPQW